MHIEERTLDVAKQEGRAGQIKPIVLRRGETGQTQIKVNLTDNGAPLTVSSMTARFCAVLPDATFVFDSAHTSAAGSAVTYTVHSDLTEAPGDIRIAYIELTSSGNIVTSDTLPIIVLDNTDISKEQAKEYQNQIDKLEKQLKDAITSASTATEKASDAAEAASTAASAANEAAGDATSAASGADSAAAAANAAAGKANTAATNADDATAAANGAASKANKAAEDTEAATSTANAAAAEATEAASAANSAAQSVDEAKEAATSAASQANSAAEAANAAAESATEAENATATAEAARVEAEKTRQSQEETRQTQESARAEAEQARTDSQAQNDLAQAKNNADQLANNQAAYNHQFIKLTDGQYDANTRKPTIEEPKSGPVYQVPKEVPTESNKYDEWYWSLTTDGAGEWEAWTAVQIADAQPIPTDKIDTILSGVDASGDETMQTTQLSYYHNAAQAKNDEKYDAKGAAASVDAKVSELAETMATDKTAQAAKDDEQDKAIEAAQTAAESTAAEALKIAVEKQKTKDDEQDAAIKEALAAPDVQFCTDDQIAYAEQLLKWEVV